MPTRKEGIKVGTEKPLAEMEREITIEFLRLVNEYARMADLIKAAVTFFQQRSGCQAVGIRFNRGDDYPYYEACGFPGDFLLLENHLCARDAAGNVCRDSTGNPLLECLCGTVICGRFDPKKPFFTSGGSFWTNSTTHLLATTTEEDLQTHTRNHCNGEGYESAGCTSDASTRGTRGGALSGRKEWSWISPIANTPKRRSALLTRNWPAPTGS